MLLMAGGRSLTEYPAMMRQVLGLQAGIEVGVSMALMEPYVVKWQPG